MRQQCFGKALCWVLYGMTVLVRLLMPAYGHAESPSPAGAQAPRAAPQPPATPVLRIEAGMHTASINRIDVDAAERFLVTASDDKTARVWDLANGKLLQILRPPLGAGSEGKLYAVAISPDGTLVELQGDGLVPSGMVHIRSTSSSAPVAGWCGASLTCPIRSIT